MGCSNGGSNGKRGAPVLRTGFTNCYFGYIGERLNKTRHRFKKLSKLDQLGLSYSNRRKLTGAGVSVSALPRYLRSKIGSRTHGSRILADPAFSTYTSVWYSIICISYNEIERTLNSIYGNPLLNLHDLLTRFKKKNCLFTRCVYPDLILRLKRYLTRSELYKLDQQVVRFL